jgi:Spy/CpxP family protein refolding chaperone
MQKISFLMSMLFVALVTMAQPHKNCQGGNETREKFKSQKIAFLTNKLSLTTTEAQEFWPVYNEMENKMDEIKGCRREAMKECKGNIETLSDKEIEDAIDVLIKNEQKEAEIKSAYHEKFKKILGPRKVLLLYQSEKDFKAELLNKMKGPKGHGPNPIF